MEKTGGAVLSTLTQRLKGIKADSIMTRSIVSTTKETSLAEVSRLMIEKRVSGLPVIENGEVIGMITMTDLFTVMGMIRSGAVIEDGKKEVLNPTVNYAMSRQVFGIDPEASLDDIMSIISSKGIHTLPVMKGKELIGIIGRRDVFRHFYATLFEVFKGV